MLILGLDKMVNKEQVKEQVLFVVELEQGRNIDDFQRDLETLSQNIKMTDFFEKFPAAFCTTDQGTYEQTFNAKLVYEVCFKIFAWKEVVPAKIPHHLENRIKYVAPVAHKYQM